MPSYGIFHKKYICVHQFTCLRIPIQIYVRVYISARVKICRHDFMIASDQLRQLNRAFYTHQSLLNKYRSRLRGVRKQKKIDQCVNFIIFSLRTLGSGPKKKLVFVFRNMNKIKKLSCRLRKKLQISTSGYYKFSYKWVSTISEWVRSKLKKKENISNAQDSR